MCAFLDHRDIKPVRDFAAGHAGPQLRQAAIICFDRNVAGFAHELDFQWAFDNAHFGSAAVPSLIWALGKASVKRER